MQGRPSWDDQFAETASERNERLRRKRLAAKCPHCTGNPVIGRPHDIKGQAIAAFVTIKHGIPQTDGLKDEVKQHVAKKIGALARPDDVIYAAELPKTRSGKIMRRLLRDVAEGRALGDTTTLADPAVVATLKTQYEDREA